MNWGEFAAAAPDLAAEGATRFTNTGLCLVGSIRKDGTPRISPCEIVTAHGELYLGMMWRSQKALDLRRDARCVVHSTVSDRMATEGEFKLRGRAVETMDPEVRERYCEALYAQIAWRPPGEEWHLFTLDIESAALVTFENEQKSVVLWPPR